ncbi:MAG: DNA polymerase III subunit epsilon, partial [Chloroflexi bacterium]|nr:DNA polymerase III subunit epsilon [Chloroflexota bacterium]
MPDEFVAIDLETTGLRLEEDRITEIGATRFDRAGRAETFHALVNPGRPIPPEIQELTSITDADVAGAPLFSVVAPRLAAFVAGRAVVGQNIQFDIAFLAAEGVPISAPTYDTWELASVLLPTAERLNLGSLAGLLGVARPVAHRALADAEAARDIFLALLARLDALPRSLLVELRAFAARGRWGVLDLIDDALARGGGSAAPAVSDEEAAAIVAALPPPPAGAPPPPLEPAAVRRAVTAGDLDALFAAAGQRRGLFPGYERRPGQQSMAEAVRRALEHGGHLAAEAGTGTGKSLAYLLPALLNALRNGDRVVVSTHTLNLQEQLAAREIPLAAALVEAHEGAPAGSLRAAVLKGRANYLCMERWAAVRLDPRPRTEAEARLFGRVATWLPGTASGDVAELYMTSAEEPAWAQLNADGADCLARRCSFVRDGSCFVLRARQRAAAAHAVVVNHALLLANAARDDQVLPPFRQLVIDEAHRLEDVATQHYGASLSLRELREVLDGAGAADRHGRPGIAARLLAAALDGQPLSLAAGLRPVAA